MEQLTELEKELVDMIIDECNVLDEPENVTPESPIVGPDSPFDLDSLDAVEIVVAVQKKFGVRIGNQQTSRKVFESIRTLSTYVEDNRDARP